MWVILHTYELGEPSHDAIGPFATREEAEWFLARTFGPAPFRSIIRCSSPTEIEQHLGARR